jgi:EAL domain-containing protein (putative c-di-GMP-specific phosphodiesterase class I)
VVVNSEALRQLMAATDLERVVLEMTEHAPIADYDELRRSLQLWRERGLRIAVDDAGAGYSSLRHILWLTPEWIKLDVSITRNIDSDMPRSALAAALIDFASRVGSSIVAEGVESTTELSALRELGATAAQGYHLGRPTSFTRALTTARPVDDLAEQHSLYVIAT